LFNIIIEVAIISACNVVNSALYLSCLKDVSSKNDQMTNQLGISPSQTAIINQSEGGILRLPGYTWVS